ncbi:MAG: pyridoxal kinase [Alphaproteobacteria bacterium]|nr:pyridoxal kinase [Alphaproteobacteria bacterium]
MCILSIQSHVAYGYVGNKAAVYPLQSMGYDVWPVHTVQFSNHTGYGKWTGEIFSAEHVREVVRGIEALGKASECRAILSGYMGSREICEAVAEITRHFKTINPGLLYLCDPVIGNTTCFVKPEVLDFFQTQLTADIITPNQYEAETLSGMPITNATSLKNVACFFHDRGTRIVVITGIKLPDVAEGLCVFGFFIIILIIFFLTLLLEIKIIIKNKVIINKL